MNKVPSAPVPRYVARHFARIDLWHLSGWAIKVYGISVTPPTDGHLIDAGLVEAAKARVATLLPRMNATPHYGVGFVVLHHARDVNWLLTQWWTDECVCRQQLDFSPFDGALKFEPADNDLMACVWELVPIDFERRAWISTVMAEKPIEDYIGSWLPDGMY